MTSSLPELPHDLAGCHLLIRQLHMEAQRAAEQATTWELKARDSEARVDHLESLVAEYRQTVSDYEEAVERLTADNKLLKRCLFGSRRERYTDDPRQTLLFDSQAAPPVATDEAAQPASEPASPPKKKRTSKGRQRRVFPDFLPREEERYGLDDADIPEGMRNHPRARRFFKKVGERIELIPMQLKVIEQYQEFVALDQPDETTTMVSAKRPVTLIQSFAGVSLLAHLTVCRFADHLPYYRLEDILGRSGLHLDRSTQWRWMHRLPTMTPEELPSLLPDRWLQDHPQHLLPYRVQEAIERAQRAHEQRAARRVAA